jgi:hypothetical protein
MAPLNFLGLATTGSLLPKNARHKQTMLLRRARTQLILTKQASLKLSDLFVFLEKMPDELERMRYTNAWTRTNMATFISVGVIPRKYIHI